jgi:uncharacterized protein (DUF427 family)
MHPVPIKPGPGQESVWDYPRPPRVERTDRHLRVVFNGVTIAETRRALRVLETSHPPVYYIPPEDVLVAHLVEVAGSTWCEWKGRASYYDVVVDGRRVERAAWTYHEPHGDFEAIKDHIAFYPGRMDACYVDGERVTPQPGGFYGGWITSDVVGPFKGAPGTRGW